MGSGGSWASHMMLCEHGWLVTGHTVILPQGLCSSATNSPWVKSPKGVGFGFMLVVVVVLKDCAERGLGTSTVCCCAGIAAAPPWADVSRQPDGMPDTNPLLREEPLLG